MVGERQDSSSPITSRTNKKMDICLALETPSRPGRREFERRADHIHRKNLARWLFVPLAIVLILLALLVAAVPFVLLRLNRIVAHPLRVIPLLLIMLTLLFVGHGLCAAHL